MRIGFDARWYNDSGVGTYVLGLLHAYSRIKERDIEIVVFENPRNPVPVTSCGPLRRVAVSANRYSLAEQLVLPRLCNRERIELFHSPFFVMPYFCECPVVTTLFDLAPFHFPIYNKLKTRIIQQGYRAAGSRASRVLTCSSYSAEDIALTLRVPRQKIRVIPLACVAGLFTPVVSRDDETMLERFQIESPYVLMLGARNWRTKNLATGLKALAECGRRSRIKFQIVFAGDTLALRGPSALEAAAELQIRSTGPVSTTELATLYRHAAVFLFPSRFEGFGIPLVEAMTSGCAVVCSNSASLAEVAGDGAITVLPDDVSGMAAAVAALLEDEATRQHWKARALRRASNFSFARTASETLDLYREVLGITSLTSDLSQQGKQCQDVR